MVDLDEDTEKEVIFANVTDARLRLECLRTAHHIGRYASAEELFRAAEEIYDWTMETQDVPEEPSTITPEDQCGKRH